ncbi:hypothetical protein NLX83_22210 [Allokutzneria sp. A3M-2-11 16]|nr:hypothetical protein [Allokutzneria sp. A3M-2-11 16]
MDLLPPVAIYYGLHLLGASDWVALLAAVVISALRVVWSAVREHNLNPFAAYSLLSYGIGLAATFISGDARFLMLKDVILVAAAGIAFLVTAARGHRPLSVIVQQAWAPSRSVEIYQAYQTNPDVRRRHRFSCTVAGLTLMAFAVVKTVLILLLPISVVVGLAPVIQLTTIGTLIAWNVRYFARAASVTAPAVARLDEPVPSLGGRAAPSGGRSA